MAVDFVLPDKGPGQVRFAGQRVSPDALAAWCSRWLGAEPDRVLFRVEHISSVIGLTLADGRAVVLKVRPPAERIHACVLVQRYLWAAGFPCPEPLAGPAALGAFGATAETLVRGGARLAQAADSPQLFARALARLVSLAPPVSSLPTLHPTPYWMQWDHVEAGTWPRDPDVDLNAHVGPSWLEDLGRRARGALALSRTLAPLVGHADWESQNLRWVSRRLHVVHDWDSVVSLPEATIAGAAAIVFPATGMLNELATIEQSDAFLNVYEAERGHPWSETERQVCWAAGLWVQAFKAKKATVRGETGEAIDALATQARERLRRAKA